MPSKKKKYNARFPAGRIKKIMQTDEEVGKVAQAVPVIISRTLELFVESLLTKSMQITQTRNAKTLTPSHMKQCILSESRFDFLKDLVKNVPDPSTQEDNENDANEALDYSLNKSAEDSPQKDKSDIVANFYVEQGPSVGRTPVIQYGPSVKQMEKPKLSFSIDSLVNKDEGDSKAQAELSKTVTSPIPSSSQTQVPHLVPTVNNKPAPNVPASTISLNDNVPPLIPISRNNTFGQNSGDNNLYIDEDYDN